MSFLKTSSKMSVPGQVCLRADNCGNGVTVVLRDHRKRGCVLESGCCETEPRAGVYGSRSSAEFGVLRHFLPLARFRRQRISIRVCLSF